MFKVVANFLWSGLASCDSVTTTSAPQPEFLGFWGSGVLGPRSRNDHGAAHRTLHSSANVILGHEKVATVASAKDHAAVTESVCLELGAVI